MMTIFGYIEWSKQERWIDINNSSLPDDDVGIHHGQSGDVSDEVDNNRNKVK